MERFRYPNDMVDLAAYVGKYRKALIDQGVPDELADTLVRDWHQQALTSDEQRILRLTNVEHISKT